MQAQGQNIASAPGWEQSLAEEALRLERVILGSVLLDDSRWTEAAELKVVAR